MAQVAVERVYFVTVKEVTSRMATVVLREGESQQNLLRRFRKKVAEGRVLSTVRKKRFYVSKSEQRRLAQRKAIRRERRRQWKQRRYR